MELMSFVMTYLMVELNVNIYNVCRFITRYRRVCLRFTKTRLFSIIFNIFVKTWVENVCVTVPKGEKTWLTIESERLGANVIQVPMGYLSNIQHKAKVYCEENGATLFRLVVTILLLLKPCVELQSLESIKRFVHPKEVWTVMSSGVLSRGLQMGWPNKSLWCSDWTQHNRGRDG